VQVLSCLNIKSPDRRGLQRRFNRLSDMMVDVNKQRMQEGKMFVWLPHSQAVVCCCRKSLFLHQQDFLPSRKECNALPPNAKHSNSFTNYDIIADFLNLAFCSNPCILTHRHLTPTRFPYHMMFLSFNTLKAYRLSELKFLIILTVANIRCFILIQCSEQKARFKKSEKCFPI
jgi:hypothetical protein